jgi:AcrR family transcriptional regulator
MVTDTPPEVETEQILEAAIACFTELGYEATTVDAIAERSGFSPAIVARHFPDKAAIRASLLDLWSERLSAWITNA